MKTVRVIQAEDKDAILKIWRSQAKGLGAPRPQSINSAIQSGECHVVLQDGVIAGFALFHKRRDGWTTLYDIAIHPEYQRQGLGAFLLWSLPTPLRLRRLRTIYFEAGMR